MTEKRFEMIITSADGSFYYLDKNTGEKITSTLELENKLNALHEENEQLKQTNQRLNDELQETMGYLALKSGVEKENEQLKKKCEYMEDVLNNQGYEVVFNGERWVIE